MKTLKLHGALFALAAIAAFLTWTRDRPDPATARLPLVWERDTTEVVAVRYTGPQLTLEIERRSDEGGVFLWGRQQAGPLFADSAGASTAPASLEYPVGGPGHVLVARLAALRVIRDLGPLTPAMATRFGLDSPAEEIELRFADETRVLAVGDSAFGGADRYVHDRTSGAAWVIAAEITRPLSLGEGAIRERWLHRYNEADVATVRIALPDGRTREMTRTEAGEWIDPATAAPDAAFANFMQRVDQLAIGGYGAAPDPVRTRPVLRADFLDDAGEALGFVELLHDPEAGRDSWYIRSETTRIVALAVGSLAERVEEGLTEIFR